MSLGSGVIPAFLLVNPYQVPHQQGWWWYDNVLEKRMGPYPSREAAVKAHGGEDSRDGMVPLQLQPH